MKDERSTYLSKRKYRFTHMSMRCSKARTWERNAYILKSD